MQQISIIIPIYQAEARLKECLESVASQNFKDFEVLLVDDGSTDGSSAICREFCAADSRFVYIRQENRGASAARNTGLDKARGEYICFVDADDILEPTYLSAFVGNIADSDVLVQGRFWHMDGKMYSKTFDFNYVREASLQKGDLQSALFMLYKRNQLGYLWTMMYKRNIIENNKIRFREDMKCQEDMEFITHYMKHVQSIRMLPECHYHYFFLQPKNDYTYYYTVGGLSLTFARYKELFSDEYYSEILRAEVDMATACYLHEIKQLSPDERIGLHNLFWQIFGDSVSSCQNKKFRLMALLKPLSASGKDKILSLLSKVK